MEQRETVKKITAGLFINSVDLVLFAASLGLNLYTASFKAKSPVKVLIDSYKLTKYFQDKLLSRSCAYAKQKGYLKKTRESLEITKLGLEKITKELPKYKKKRNWNGRLKLITYDISEKQRKKRRALAWWLKSSEAIHLQKSVWVSVYDLSDKLKKAKKEFLFKDQGMILLSELKKGKGIDEQSIKELVNDWYKLDRLNLKYSNFISWVKMMDKIQTIDKFILRAKYLSILKDDPQLPQETLPKDWLGDKAYQEYQNNLNI